MTAEKINTIKAILQEGIEGFKEQAKALDRLNRLDHVICNGTAPVLDNLTEEELREIATVLLVSPYMNPLPSVHPSSYINMTLEEENLEIMQRKALEKHLGELLKARKFIVTPEITNYLKVSRGQAIYASLGDISFRSREDARGIIETLPEGEQSQFDNLLQEQKQLRDTVIGNQKKVMHNHDQSYISAVLDSLSAAPDILLEQGKQERINTVLTMAEKDSTLVIDLSQKDLSDLDLSNRDLHQHNLQGANLRGTNLRGVNLQDADLTDADLTDADLTDTDLTGARVSARSIQGAKDIEMLGLSEIDLVHDKEMPINPMIDGLDPITLRDARALTLESLCIQLEQQKRNLEKLPRDNSRKFIKIQQQLHQNISKMEKELEHLAQENANFLPILGIKGIEKAISQNQKPLDSLSEQMHRVEKKKKKKNFIKSIIKQVVKTIKSIVGKFYINEQTLASEIYEEAASIESILPNSTDLSQKEGKKHTSKDQEKHTDRRQKKHLRRTLNHASDEKIRDFRVHDIQNSVVTEHGEHKRNL